MSAMVRAKAIADVGSAVGAGGGCCVVAVLAGDGVGVAGRDVAGSAFSFAAALGVSEGGSAGPAAAAWVGSRVFGRSNLL